MVIIQTNPHQQLIGSYSLYPSKCIPSNKCILYTKRCPNVYLDVHLNDLIIYVAKFLQLDNDRKLKLSLCNMYFQYLNIV